MAQETRVQSQLVLYQQMVLAAPLINTQHYKAWIKDKLSDLGKGVVPSPTPWHGSYWKGSFQVTLN